MLFGDGLTNDIYFTAVDAGPSTDNMAFGGLFNSVPFVAYYYNVVNEYRVKWMFSYTATTGESLGQVDDVLQKWGNPYVHVAIRSQTTAIASSFVVLAALSPTNGDVQAMTKVNCRLLANQPSVHLTDANGRIYVALNERTNG